MNRDELDELADQKYNEMIDERLCQGVCVDCAGPMPRRLDPKISYPIRCPNCRPGKWEEHHTYSGPTYGYSAIKGVKVYSPIGEGVVTGCSNRGYPKVNEIAVTWVQILEEGISNG